MNEAETGTEVFSLPNLLLFGAKGSAGFPNQLNLPLSRFGSQSKTNYSNKFSDASSFKANFKSAKFSERAEF